MTRDLMGLEALGDLIFLPSTVVVVIAAILMTQLPSADIVSVALCVVIRFISTGIEVRSAF